MRRFDREEAFTGLEAAIVLIAFVVVAAVFSYVVLGAGFFTTQKSQEVVYEGVGQASSSMEILGDVYGLDMDTVADDPLSIDVVRFTVGLTAGGTPIDFQTMTLTFSTADAVTAIAKDAGINATITPTTSAAIGAGTWGVERIDNAIGGQMDPLLEEGEQFTIVVGLPAADELAVNDAFNLEIRPAKGAAIGIKRTGPSKIAEVNLLY